MVGQVDDGELWHMGTRKQRGIAKQKIETGCVGKTTHQLAGLTGWLTTQLIPYQAFSYRDPVPRYLAWAANSLYPLLDRVHGEQ